MKLTKFEREFILAAIKLKDSVLLYNGADEEFKDAHGCSKRIADTKLNFLKAKLNNQ